MRQHSGREKQLASSLARAGSTKLARSGAATSGPLCGLDR
jgi:hypothetical protein